MLNESEIIVKGPDLPFELFQESFSEYIISNLRSHPKDNIFQINANTGEEITFHEFLKLSIEIGEGLIKDGLRKKDIIVLAGRNSTHLHASAYGVLFSGGVFCAVDPQLKIFEMQSLYEQLQPKYIFCDYYVENEVQQCLKNMNSKAKIVVINASLNYKTKNVLFEDLLTDVDVNNYTPCVINNPAEDVAFILCSSGSTGIPKGVQITHRNMVYQMQCWEHLDVEMAVPEKYLQTSNFFWVSGTVYVFLNCIFGQTNVYIREINEVSILSAIDKYKPSSALIPPSDLLAILNFPNLKKYDVSSMKYVLTGGAFLPKVIVDRMHEFSEHAKLVQGYGMTEMAGIVTKWEPDGDVFSCGTPLYGQSIKVVDISTRKSLGPNQCGELLYKSIGLTKGYMGNEEATKAAIDEGGWFHSGDLGYYDENKHIYLVDRIKEIIKFRNLQVSPVEIEAYIKSLPGVKEAAVLGIPNEEDTNHPMALVIKKEGSSITAEEIVEKVKSNLISYKQLRAGVYFVDELPRSGSGKIKRGLLKEIGRKIYDEAKKQSNVQNK